MKMRMLKKAQKMAKRKERRKEMERTVKRCTCNRCQNIRKC